MRSRCYCRRVSISAWLEEQRAHHDIVSWARAFGDDWERVWLECPRGDWLLGLAVRRQVAPRYIVRAARDCALLPSTQLPDEEPWVARVFEVIEAWLAGTDEPAERQRALTLVEAAIDEAPDAGSQAAAIAVRAALGAIDELSEAPTAAAAAAEAVLHDVGDCAMMSALRWAHAQCAERVRAAVPLADITGSPRPD